MNKVQHPNCNGMVDMGDQGALPVMRVNANDEGAPPDIWTSSFWKPDATEMAALLAGRPLIVMVRGVTHPALFVTVESQHAPL